MSLGLSVATVLQTSFVVAFLLILMPFRIPQRRWMVLTGGIMATLCVGAGVLSACFGLPFLLKYGYLLVGLPLFATVYLFSQAKGSRFTFMVLTILVFHRIISTLLTVVRVFFGGFTPLYFLANFLLFGVLLYGAWRLRKDFHKIVFSYPIEFGCLSSILLLLLVLVWVFSPITDLGQVDSDILLVAALLYALVVLLYIFIGISFRTFSQGLDAQHNALSLEHQMQAAQDHIKLLQLTRDKAKVYRHDLRRHLLLIGAFLDNDNIDALRDYLNQVRLDLDTVVSDYYCSNEAANLIFGSFEWQAQKTGVTLWVDAQIPPSLSISNPELCTLLSNALDNAIQAASCVEDGRERTVTLTASMLDGKLLLLVENPYTGTVHMENDLPQGSGGDGGGFGAKSMVSIVERYGGLSSFEANNGVFTLRIVV